MANGLYPWCRACGTSYEYRESGCEHCIPAKAHMGMPEMSVDLDKVVRRQLDMAQRAQDKYNSQYGGDVEFDRTSASSLKMLTESVVKISAEVRNIMKQFEGEATTPSQKDQLAIDWLASRPKAKLAQAVGLLQEVHHRKTKGTMQGDK